MQDTERSECTTQGTLGILQDAKQNGWLFLTFVTGRALLGIKSIGSHLKHVVALNADAVKNRAVDRLQLW